MYSPAQFTNLLNSVRFLTGAASASVCLSSLDHPDAPVLLIHSGGLPPVPEFADETAAQAYFRSIEQERSDLDKGGKAPEVKRYSSHENDCHILCFSVSDFQATLERQSGQHLTNERRKDPGDPEIGKEKSVWLGLRYHAQQLPIVPGAVSRQAPSCAIPETLNEGLTWGLALSSSVMWELHELTGLTQDSVSQLPGRVEFQKRLNHLFNNAVRKREPLGIMLINPDDFGLVNHRLGRELGDRTLQEIAHQIRDALRKSDAVFRFGGAVFAALLPSTGTVECTAAAEKLRSTLSLHTYADTSVRLAFSIGFAVHEPGDNGEDPIAVDSGELLSEADRALNMAKLAGGGCTLKCRDDSSADQRTGNLDRLSGIFTADTEKDYRNMLLLWDTVTFISSYSEPDAIARTFVERLSAIFKPRKSMLFTYDKEGQPSVLAAFPSRKELNPRAGSSPDANLTTVQKTLLDQVRRQRQIVRKRVVSPTSGNGSKNRLLVYVVPMHIQGDSPGCLYFEGPEGSFKLDSSDLVFLNGIANQVALALDRANLAANWKREQEREKSRLKQELRGLRQAVGHSKFVFQSPQMQAVFDTIRRIGPIDATVLITGESGTGKEVLARALHKLSTRQDRPFVTVDCGAIAKSLLEAELFGYVKGAFTGAESNSLGRIVQADSGTLFLDEIGELPLDIQSKLLRFVQEKEITPVGSSKPRSVNIRIVAATNRNLVKEVSAGRFRQDLYFRLQVFTVTAPPLRKRPDDILPIAYHYVEKFSAQYDIGKRVLGAAAENALIQYDWPGNVRELQNRILQAVIMAAGEEISLRELNLDGDNAATLEQTDLPSARTLEKIEPPPASPAFVDPGQTHGSESPNPQANRDPWDTLRQLLDDQVRATLASGNGSLRPLGRCLTEDLILEADARSGGIARRASLSLGMAETTFRRQLQKARTTVRDGNHHHVAPWESLRPVIHALIGNSGGNNGVNIVEKARDILLEAVTAHLPGDHSRGSAIMDVTRPTYRRWVDQIQASSDDHTEPAKAVANLSL